MLANLEPPVKANDAAESDHNYFDCLRDWVCNFTWAKSAAAEIADVVDLCSNN